MQRASACLVPRWACPAAAWRSCPSGHRAPRWAGEGGAAAAEVHGQGLGVEPPPLLLPPPLSCLRVSPSLAQVLQQAGAKLLSREPSNTSDASRFKAGDSLETAVLDTEDAAAKAARGGGLGSGPSPGATPLWTPPIATHATPPATGATPPMIHASPGGFWEVLNAQIYSPDLAPPPAAAAALPAAAPPGMHEPTVTGLPLPPCQQQQQQQQQLGGMRLAALPGTATQDDGRGACSVSIYSANLIVDTKGGGSLVLGVGTVRALLLLQ